MTLPKGVLIDTEELLIEDQRDDAVSVIFQGALDNPITGQYDDLFSECGIILNNFRAVTYSFLLLASE